MMTRDDFLLRCHKLTEFCMAYGGNCFAGWSKEKVFFFVGFHALAGTLFVREAQGKIKSLAVAWLDDAAKIARRESDGEFQFKWKLPAKGDSLVISGVIGDRDGCRELYQKAMKKWPFVKRFFTWRDSRLVELTPETMRRFAT